MLVPILLAIAGSFLVARPEASFRLTGFCFFIIANVTWIGYGIAQNDHWIVTQFALFTIASVYGIWSHRDWLKEKFHGSPKSVDG